MVQQTHAQILPIEQEDYRQLAVTLQQVASQRSAETSISIVSVGH